MGRPSSAAGRPLSNGRPACEPQSGHQILRYAMKASTLARAGVVAFASAFQQTTREAVDSLATANYRRICGPQPL